MQPKGGRARLRARPPFRYAFYSQNPQKCLRGGFFEGFRGPREGFLRVFQNFRGRRRVFLRFFEGFLLALEKPEPEPEWTGTGMNRNRGSKIWVWTEPNRTEPWVWCFFLNVSLKKASDPGLAESRSDPGLVALSMLHFPWCLFVFFHGISIVRHAYSKTLNNRGARNFKRPHNFWWIFRVVISGGPRNGGHSFWRPDLSSKQLGSYFPAAPKGTAEGK